MDDGKKEETEQVDGKEEDGGHKAACPAGDRNKEGQDELKAGDDDEGLALGEAKHKEFVVEVEAIGVKDTPFFADAAPDGGNGVKDGNY